MAWYEHLTLVLARFIREIDVPSLALGVMALIGCWMMIKAQRRPDFDWGNLFKDQDGKESAARLGMVAALALSTWLLIFVTMNTPKSAFTGDLLFNIFCVFMAVWSGAKIVDKALDLLIARWTGTKPVALAATPPALPG